MANTYRLEDSERPVSGTSSQSDSVNIDNLRKLFRRGQNDSDTTSMCSDESFEEESSGESSGRRRKIVATASLLRRAEEDRRRKDTFEAFSISLLRLLGRCLNRKIHPIKMNISLVSWHRRGFALSVSAGKASRRSFRCRKASCALFRPG